MRVERNSELERSTRTSDRLQELLRPCESPSAADGSLRVLLEEEGRGGGKQDWSSRCCLVVKACSLQSPASSNGCDALRWRYTCLGLGGERDSLHLQILCKRWSRRALARHRQDSHHIECVKRKPNGGLWQTIASHWDTSHILGDAAALIFLSTLVDAPKLRRVPGICYFGLRGGSKVHQLVASRIMNRSAPPPQEQLAGLDTEETHTRTGHAERIKKNKNKEESVDSSSSSSISNRMGKASALLLCTELSLWVLGHGHVLAGPLALLSTSCAFSRGKRRIKELEEKPIRKGGRTAPDVRKGTEETWKKLYKNSALNLHPFLGDHNPDRKSTLLSHLLSLAGNASTRAEYNQEEEQTLLMVSFGHFSGAAGANNNKNKSGSRGDGDNEGEDEDEHGCWQEDDLIEEESQMMIQDGLGMDEFREDSNRLDGAQRNAEPANFPFHYPANDTATRPRNMGVGERDSSSSSVSDDPALIAFTVYRAVVIFLNFLPFIVFFAAVVGWMKMRSLIHKAKFDEEKLVWLWPWLRSGISRSGAAFIKWGQWAATREDMFPGSMCRSLSALHDQAPFHSYYQTRRIISQSYGKSIEETFVAFDPTPIASGSIAQVYKAKVEGPDGKEIEVAVKVRHPAVKRLVVSDYQVIDAVLSLCTKALPRSRNLANLRDSMKDFPDILFRQTNLKIEAENLSRFYRNFLGPSGPAEKNVIPPIPFTDLTTDDVLVESFEAGSPLTTFLERETQSDEHDTQVARQMAAMGTDIYFKMLLVDNFLHLDLHPGNILGRWRTGEDDDTRMKVIEFIILDFGLAMELHPKTRRHFISFISAVASGNARRAANHILSWNGSLPQRCRDVSAFRNAMVLLFRDKCNLRKGFIDASDVLQGILQLARDFSVTIDSNFAMLGVGLAVVSGFAKSLDPELCILHAAVPLLLAYQYTGRVMGRLYD